MAHQIIRVHLEPESQPRHHQHIEGVELSDGTRMTRDDVIAEIERGEAYYTEVDGNRAAVYVHPCPTCNVGDYITTRRDRTEIDNLGELPTF